jgi:predicted permease
MLLGYGLKQLKMATKDQFNAINRLIFKVFLPIHLFYSVYKTDIKSFFDGKLILFAVVTVLIVFAVGYGLVFLFTKENAKRGVMLQGFFRSNFAILGIPLVNYICGESAGGLSALIVAIIIPLYNILAVITLERFRDGKIQFGKLLKGIATNPLVISCLIGVIFLALGIQLPSLVETTVSDAASIASPLAIVVLGASFNFSTIKTSIKELAITVCTRLLIVPALAIAAAVWLGFRGEALVCLMVAFGAPTAVSSFSMAQQMGGDEELAAQIVVFTSALCLFSLFGWIFLLSSLQLF